MPEQPPPTSPPPPRLTVETTAADLEDVLRLALERSPSQRRQLRLLVAGGVLLLLALGGVLCLVERHPWPMALSVVAVAGFCWYVPRALPRAMAASTRRLLAEGADEHVLGPHEHVLLADRLVTRGPHGEQWVALRSLHDVVRTPAGAYVFLDPANVLALPRHRVLAGDHAVFVDALVHAWEAARRPSPSGT